MKNGIALAARLPRKNVLIVNLAIAVVFGLVTRPHVQRYCSCTGTVEVIDAFPGMRFHMDVTPLPLGIRPQCDVAYRFEWGY